MLSQTRPIPRSPDGDNKVMNGPTSAKIGPTRAKTRLKRVKNCVFGPKSIRFGGEKKLHFLRKLILPKDKLRILGVPPSPDESDWTQNGSIGLQDLIGATYRR